MLIGAETAVPTRLLLTLRLLWEILPLYSHPCLRVSRNQKPDSSCSSQIPVYYELFQHPLSGFKQKSVPAAHLFPCNFFKSGTKTEFWSHGFFWWYVFILKKITASSFQFLRVKTHGLAEHNHFCILCNYRNKFFPVRKDINASIFKLKALRVKWIPRDDYILCELRAKSKHGMTQKNSNETAHSSVNL